jgi:hypothetical protein
MRGLRDRTATVVIRGHAFMPNIGRAHYEVGVDARLYRRLAAAFREFAQTI